MQRLFHAILIGAFVGGAAALWLPPHEAARLGEFVATVQARAQEYVPQRGRQVQPAAQPPAAQPRTSPSGVDLGDAEDWPAAEASDAPQGDYPSTDAPPAGSDNEGYGEEAPPPGNAPFDDYPRTEESAVLDARIEQFESAQIIARVGPDVVLAGEVLPEVKARLAQFGEIPPEYAEQARMVATFEALQKILPNKILVVDARRKLPEENWKKIQEQIDASFRERGIARLMKQYEARDLNDLSAKLQAAGSSLEAERHSYGETQIARTWGQQNLEVNQEITYEDLVGYYREHRADFEIEGRSRWEQLSIRFDRFPDREAAFAEIARLGNMVVQEGVPFADVAREHSHGLTAADGGRRDWTRQGSLVSKELDGALFALPVGRLSRILEDEQGYHIVRVVERQEAGTRPFEEVQNEIREKINEERFKVATGKYLETLQAEIPVTTIFDEIVAQERAKRQRELEEVSELPGDPLR